MRLENTAGKIAADRTTSDFVAVTAGHIEAQIEAMEINVILLDVQVIIYGQTVVQPRPDTATAAAETDQGDNSPQSRRFLQPTVQPLRVGFNTIITWQSPEEDSNPAEWIGEAFNSEDKRDSYIERLQNANAFFATLNHVALLVEGERPNEEVPINTDPPPADDKDNSIIWISVASAAGGVLLAFAAGVIVYKRYQKKQERKQAYKESIFRPADKKNSVTDENGSVEQGYAAEINVERQDDVSTLGDPVGWGGMMVSAAGGGHVEDRTASVATDYDYARAFLGGGTLGGRDRLESTDSEAFAQSSNTASSASGFSKQTTALAATHAVFADDASFDEVFDRNNIKIDTAHPRDESSSSVRQIRFRVDVPPGKLGMVLDTPNGGAPSVHAIKSDSVLRDQVRVGDYLVECDGEDVSRMTAVQVSKLISMKSNQERLMVFVRQERGGAEDIVTSDEINAC